ncbi:MAG: intein-containing DNA gyrase subunit A [Actinomycetales bacterium]
MAPTGGTIEPVDLQLEMQRSYLDYAMSVIVGRALPEVRDGLKPVHRRVLYAMYDGGYRPDRGYNKCSRVVGDVMGQYHPHGDSAIYDTLVRLAQPWALRYPLVDGQGNFGSPGNDRAAAMRYCVAGETRVRLADGTTPRIDAIVPHAIPNTDTDVDLKVVGRSGEVNRATKLFHSGDQQTLRLLTDKGYELTGSTNHPVLTLGHIGGVPLLLWKRLDEMSAGDHVVLSRRELHDYDASEPDVDMGRLLGAFVSEGWVSQRRAGFTNVDPAWFASVLDVYDRLVGGRRYLASRTIASGSLLHELDIQDLSSLLNSPLKELQGCRSGDKRVPVFVWSANATVKSAFLQWLFTGDGSVSALPRSSVQVCYSTRSNQLARDVQTLLLEFGIVSKLCRYPNGEIKVVLSNRRDVRLFASAVGFYGLKHAKLDRILSGIPQRSTSLSADRIPYVADYLRAHGGVDAGDRAWLQRHNIDRIERWEREWGEDILEHLTTEAADVVYPLVDGRFYYATVKGVEDAGVRPVYSLRVDSEDHAFITDGFVSHNTECRMAPLAMEMVRDIDEETVDFQPNYDGKTLEPLILPSRFPNLLVNGSAGIAVGMATNIPPHNLREVADGVQWYLQNPEANAEELLDALMTRISGPDFPTGALVLGRRGIEDAFRTGRGSITMRAIVEVEEIQNRTCLVVTELPYQVNPDNLALKIAELVKAGKVGGIADVRDETSGRTGQRLVIVLKRDAVAKVVLNNLYKHTQLQDNFGANMLALVDGVPRTLPLDGFVRHWVEHQLEVIQRRTRYRLRKAEEEAHILRGYLKALDMLDEVIALIRASATVEDARDGLIGLLEIDEIQATAILNMQLRRLAALERQKIIDRYDELMALIEDYNAILSSPERQRTIVGDELRTLVDKYGDERRTRIVPFDGDMSMEDLIPQEEVVVTITRGGYAKRTRVDQYRSQRRGGKGVRGAQLRGEDVVDHFFTTTTHDWLLFFTNLGRVYRAKAYELPEAARDAKGQHVANLLAFQPGEQIAQVLDIKSYEQSPYLVLATRRGLVKKTRLTEYDSNRTGGLIAVNLREWDGAEPGEGDGDEVVSARLVSADDDLLLVSRKGMSVRFTATDEALRPMGRATSGVTGMKFRAGDELLAMDVVRPDAEGVEPDVFVVFENGLAKRTPIAQYRPQGRGGLGIKVAKVSDRGGDLVGALTVTEGDEVLVVMERGKVVRSRVDEVRPTGRDTSGVRFATPDADDAIIAVARNPERVLGEIEGLEDAEDADGFDDADLEQVTDNEPAGEGAVQARSAERSDRAAEPVDGVPSSVEHESDDDNSTVSDDQDEED